MGNEGAVGEIDLTFVGGGGGGRGGAILHFYIHNIFM